MSNLRCELWARVRPRATRTHTGRRALLAVPAGLAAPPPAAACCRSTIRAAPTPPAAADIRLRHGRGENNAPLRDNRAAFAELGFIPRVLGDVSRPLAQPRCSASVRGALRHRADGHHRTVGVPRRPRAGRRRRRPDPDDHERLVADPPRRGCRRHPHLVPGLPAGRTTRIVASSTAWQAGYVTLVITVDTAVLRTARTTCARLFHAASAQPAPGMGWPDPAALVVGTFLRTLLNHGMPHFENSYAERGAPILSATWCATSRSATISTGLTWRDPRAGGAPRGQGHDACR